MANDEYEILPHSSIDKLKSDLENLKQQTSSGSGKQETLEAVNDLKESIESLMNLFKVASEEMKMEEAESHGVEKRLGPLIKKVDTLIEQNQQLAQGLVVVADMIKEHLPQIEDKLRHLNIRPIAEQKHKPEPPKHEPVHSPPKEHKPYQPQHPFAPQQPPSLGPQPPIQASPFPPFSGSAPAATPQRGPPDFGSPAQQGPMPPNSQPNSSMDLPPLGAPEPFPGLEDKQKKSGLFGKLFQK